MTSHYQTTYAPIHNNAHQTISLRVTQDLPVNLDEVLGMHTGGVMSIRLNIHGTTTLTAVTRPDNTRFSSIVIHWDTDLASPPPGETAPSSAALQRVLEMQWLPEWVWTFPGTPGILNYTRPDKTCGYVFGYDSLKFNIFGGVNPQILRWMRDFPVPTTPGVATTTIWINVYGTVALDPDLLAWRMRGHRWGLTLISPQWWALDVPGSRGFCFLNMPIVQAEDETTYPELCDMVDDFVLRRVPQLIHHGNRMRAFNRAARANVELTSTRLHNIFSIRLTANGQRVESSVYPADDPVRALVGRPWSQEALRRAVSLRHTIARLPTPPETLPAGDGGGPRDYAAVLSRVTNPNAVHRSNNPDAGDLGRLFEEWAGPRTESRHRRQKTRASP